MENEFVIRERVLPEVGEFERIQTSLDSHPPLLQRVYAARGVRDVEDLKLATAGLHSPASMQGLDTAAARLSAAVTEGESVLFVGDFDADGATASALGVSLMRALGAREVDFLVPNRFDFGYGLTPEIVAVAAQSKPDLIVTVDNGISSLKGVEAANELGIAVIVTDHHLPGNELPKALAVVNPNQKGCSFPSKNLAGVGVIWYLLSAVRRVLADQGWFQDKAEPNPAQWLDLVSLGTVADVVPLDYNNRILVYQGLQRMRAGHLRPGLRAIAQVAGKKLVDLTAQDLGFALGPRLNAAGRLEDMTIGIRCLLATDDEEALRLATALNELNRARRSIETQMSQEAELAILDLADEENSVADKKGLAVYREQWHQGVVGIVAGRMRERFFRPVIAFAETGATAPDELKGSARSIPGLHIRDVLADIDTRFPGLIVRFGGHAMAAGLSLKRRHLARFAKAFDAAVDARVNGEVLQNTVLTDGELDAAELALANAELLASGGPWGQGFEEPLFHGSFELISQKVVGENHLKMVVGCGGQVFDAIKFRQAPMPGAEQVELVYHLSVNEWRDRRSLQLMVEHCRAV